MSKFELPSWTAAQPILAPRTMLGTFIWWAILGGGMDGKWFTAEAAPVVSTHRGGVYA